MRVANNFSSSELDPRLPYPPSSPSPEESDDEMLLAQTSKATFRSSLASASESTLRSIVGKLADSNPRFQRAIMKELMCTNAYAFPTTPKAPRRAPRSKSRRYRKDLSISTASPFQYKRRSSSLSSESLPSPDDSMYHPGHLEDVVYEFLSRTPDDVTLNVVRTIAMWSCCDEDEWSPGCVVAPSYSLPEGHQPNIVSFSQGVFPDSDLEQHSDNDPVSRHPAIMGSC